MSFLVVCFLLFAGAFTPPSAMCCPWIELKDDLTAVAEDTGEKIRVIV